MLEDRAASMAAFATDADEEERAAKMPPVCSQREPLTAKILCQSKSLGWLFAIAVLPRSEQPTAARTPNPRSVKFRPLRTVRPIPSYGTQRMSDVSTPPCRIKSSSNCPIGFFAKAVMTAVRMPKHRLSPRATLYSPPPSQARKVSSRVDTLLAGIKPQHDFSEADAIPLTAFRRFQNNRVHGSILAGSLWLV